MRKENRFTGLNIVLFGSPILSLIKSEYIFSLFQEKKIANNYFVKQKPYEAGVLVMKKYYYLLKPFIPRFLQLYLRRVHIQKKISEYKDVWPILKGSEKKPDNWTGWPYGKKFAFILTHDVEFKNGYDKVSKLIDLEKKYGFVSSFNFVPERDYTVTKDLLERLKNDGFEVGVHGLYHDGKLFESRKLFDQRKEKINKYLKSWDVKGFRAPAMHHNLEYIGELDIEYDLSTFDTDPFEPQPDGVGTIFPFWVNSDIHKNGGYIEIPYTLPQDFTPLILLKQTDINIWRSKLDWIVENGGMALINVHPDYINFNNNRTAEEFPVKLFEELLTYVKEKYSNQYWNVLPVEVAKYWMDNVLNKKSSFNLIHQS